jgi:hypothetical protein
MEEIRNIYKIMMRKTEGGRPLGKSRRRWEDYIRMNLTEIIWEIVD